MLFNNVYSPKYKPLVSLGRWAETKYPSTYQTITTLSEEDYAYLGSIRISSFTNTFGADHYSQNGTRSGCKKLQYIDCSNFDLSECRDAYCSFMWCSSLTSLDLTMLNVSSIIAIQGMFYSCTGLTSLDLSTWVTSSLTNSRDLFNGCSNLKVVDMSNFDFSKCSSYNADYMFYNCNSMQYLILSNPDHFVSMPTSGVSRLRSSCKILVPSSLLSTYKSATNWSSRSSYIEAIENYTITRSNGTVTVTPNS